MAMKGAKDEGDEDTLYHRTLVLTLVALILDPLSTLVQFVFMLLAKRVSFPSLNETSRRWRHRL